MRNVLDKLKSPALFSHLFCTEKSAGNFNLSKKLLTSFDLPLFKTRQSFLGYHSVFSNKIFQIAAQHRGQRRGLAATLPAQACRPNLLAKRANAFHCLLKREATPIR